MCDATATQEGKIVNHYLDATYLGLPDDTGIPTAVEEAWLVVSRPSRASWNKEEYSNSEFPGTAALANSAFDVLAQFLLWSAVGLQESETSGKGEIRYT